MNVLAKWNGKYFSQRDNAKTYWIYGDNFVDEKGKILFPAKDLDKHEKELFDRSTECFISTGTMFCNALFNARITNSPMDEIAYKTSVMSMTKGSETRFYWAAHERFLDLIIKDKDYDFQVLKAKENIDKITDSLDAGFPVMCSIWIRPWLPTAKGHLVLIVGYKSEGTRLDGFVVNDPFGDCLSQYKDHDGEKVYYPIKEFTKMINSPEDSPRFIGIARKK